MPLPVLVAGLLFVSQSAAADLARAEDARFNRCLANTETNPEAAYEDGLAWLSEGGRPLARHCTALALIALGQVEEGALRLEELATAPDAGSIEKRSIYLAQAGNAWLSIGYAKEAAVALSNALRLSPDNADLLLDRASAYILVDRHTEALTDLDKALSIIEYDPLVYQLRAAAFLGLGRLDEAKAAIEEARSLAPDDIDVLVLRGEIREAIRRRSR
ncbi:MAG: hypothetical protein AAFQ67_06060 [Pseudomonadota bacterium]